MNLALIFLCVIAIVALCVLATRRGSGGDGYRRRFENRYRHDSSSDSAQTTLWILPAGIGDAGSHHTHHHAPDAGGHCGTGADGGTSGCGDGGSS